jgi:hypothetical protein
MAKPLKENGLEELLSFKRRTHRQYGLNRIGYADFRKLSNGVEELIATLRTMEETDDMKGDEDGSS